MRLVLPILLIALGVWGAAMQVPALMSGKPRQESSPARRHTSWTWFHVGMLNTANGLLQVFHRPIWDRDPLLWAVACYEGAVLLWLVLPYIRRPRSR
jgi:hypothetical protein